MSTLFLPVATPTPHTDTRPGPAPGGVPGPPRRATLRQLVVFAAVGVATSAAYAVLYLTLTDAGLGDQVSNAAALLLTTGVNTGANRRFGFGLRGHRDAVRHQVRGALVLALTLALTSASIAAMDVAGVTGESVRTGALVAANIVAGLLHLHLLRRWVFVARMPPAGRPVATRHP